MKKLITQSNSITEARYDMGSLEKNILYLLMSKLKNNNGKNEIYRISRMELEVAVNKKINLEFFKKSAKKLVQKIIVIKNPYLGKSISINIMLSGKYLLGEGFIEMELSKEIKSMFFALKKNFTTLNLSAALSLKSRYSKRIYEMISQYRDTKNMYITVKKLKERLGLVSFENEKYKDYFLFKRKILDTAIKEINEKTELAFSYEARKTGKKYTHLHFKIQKKTKEPLVAKKIEPVKAEEISPNATFMKRLCTKYNLSVWQATKIINQVPEQELKKELYELQFEVLDGNIHNIGGYTAKRFDQKYNLGIFSTKKS